MSTKNDLLPNNLRYLLSSQSTDKELLEEYEALKKRIKRADEKGTHSWEHIKEAKLVKLQMKHCLEERSVLKSSGIKVAG